MFWRNRNKSKDELPDPTPDNTLDSKTDDASCCSSISETINDADDEFGSLERQSDREMNGKTTVRTAQKVAVVDRNPNEALFHILGRKFELYNDGDPFYINQSDVISWKELQNCFLVLVWVCTLQPSASSTNNNTKSSVEQPVKPSLAPQQQKISTLPINVASVKNKFHYSPTQLQQQPYVLMHIPVDVVYSLWEQVISLRCPTFGTASSNMENNDMNSPSQQQKWKPSTQLAMEFIRDALVSVGVIQVLDRCSTSTTNQSSSSSISKSQLIRINQDIHYQFGMFLCQSTPIYSDLILPYQHLWHSVVTRAYRSWFFQPLQQRQKEHNNNNNNSNNESLDSGVFCDYAVWDLDVNNSNLLLQLDGGYALIMLPYHFTLSNESHYISICQKLLYSNTLIQARLNLMGFVCGTVQHLNDCEQLYHHIRQRQLKQQEEVSCTDSPVCLRNVVRAIQTAYNTLYTQLHNASTNMENSVILTADVGRALHLLAISLGEIGPDTSDCFERQLTIYQEALELLKKSLGNDSIEVAETLHCIGFVKESYKGEHSSARECYMECLRIKLLHYGREHPYVSKTVHNLGTLYCEQGDYNLALAMFEETLRVRRQALGPDDDAVADTLQWIASVYRELEKHQHALEYFNEALRIKKLTVGKDHIETGNVCHNLGIVYDDLGQYKMSVKFYQEALRIRKLCLGKDDELIAESLHLMANVFLRKGDKKNSLQYYEDAIHIREQRLSLQPPNWGCASNKNNSTIEKLLECYEEVLPLKKLLGGNVNSGKEVAKVTYRIAELYNKYMRNVDKAIDYFKAFVNLQAKLLSGAGDDDQQERILLNNALQYLGTLYEEKQDYQLSVLYFEEALRSKRVMLGDNSQEVAETLFFTGCVYLKLCQNERAILYLQESCRIRESDASADTDGVVLCQHQIGLAHDALGQYEDAIMCFSAALKLKQQQNMGLNGSSTSSSISDPKVKSVILRDMGHAYDAKGEVEKALEYYQNSLTSIQTDLGERHEELGDAYYNIGNAYAKMKQLDLALKNFDAALNITNIHFEPTDLSVGNILHNKGLIHAELADYVQAKNMFEQALRVYKINLPGDSSEVANTLHNIAALSDKTAHYDDAVKFYSESLNMKRKVLGNDHLSVAQTLNNLGIVEAKRENYEAANISLQESLRIKRYCLGEHHESVASTLHNIGKIYDSKSEFDKALLCYHEALRLRKSILGNESIEVSTTLHSMGESYSKNNMVHHNDNYVTEALSCFADAVRIRKLRLGPNHMDTGNSVRELGMTYILCNKEREALLALEDFVRIFRLNGSSSLSLSYAIEVFNSLAEIYMARKDYKNGLRCLQEANELCEKHSDNTDAVVDSLYRIGSFFMEQGDNDNALDYLDRAIAKAKSIPVKYNVLVGHICSAKGALHQLKNESDAAISSFEECIRIYRENSDVTDDKIANVYRRLGELYVTQNDKEKAWECGNEALRILKKSGSKIHEIASLNDLLGSLSLARQEFSKAKAFFDEAIKIRSSALGENDISLAGSFFQLGVTLDAQAECSQLSSLSSAMIIYKESTSMYRRSLEIREMNNEHDSLHTAEVFTRLGCAHAKLKEYDDALACLKKALNIRVDNLGERTLDVADILSNIGGIYDAYGMFEKAYEFYKDSLSIYENILGSSHVRVSDVLVRVGAYHARRKEYGAAIEIYKKALTMKKQHLGDDDVSVAKTLRCMADILSHEDVGKHESAVELYKEALRISRLFEEFSNSERGKLVVKIAESCKKIAGREGEILDYYLEALQLYRLDNQDESLDFASLLLSVGKQYALKNDRENAIKCLTKCLAIRMVKLSKDDAAIGQVLAEIGEVQEFAGNYEEAVKSYSDSLAILRLTPNVESSKSLIGRLLLRLGELHSKNRNYDDSMISLVQALEILKEAHGEGNIDVGKAFYALGVVFLEQSNVDQAVSHLKSAFAILKEAFGVDSIEVSNILFHLGSALSLKQDYKSAKICFAECLQMRLSKLKSDDVLIAHVSKSLGTLLLSVQEYADALLHLEAAQKIYRKSLGKKSIEVADISSLMASSYAFQGENDKAEACFKEALRIYKSSLDDSDHLKVANLLSQMGFFYADCKMINESIDCLKQALQIKKRHFGNDDTTVAELAEKIADVLVLDGGSQYDAAIKCYLEAKRIYDISADKEDGTIDSSSQSLRSASILSKLGELYNSLGEKEKAVDFYIESLSRYQSAIGEDSIESSAVYHTLGNLYHEVDEYDMAMDSFRRSLVTRKKHLGDDHIDVAHTLREKGSVHESRGEVDEALDCYEESFRVYKLNIISGSDDAVLQLLNRAGFLAIKYSTQINRRDVKEEFFGIDDGDESCNRDTYIQKAAKFFQDALLIGKSNKNIDETTSETLADTYFGLGLVHSENSTLGAALDCFQASLKIRQEKFGEYHPQVAEAWFSLGSIFFREGDFKEALKCHDQALKIRKKLLTSDSLTEEFAEVGSILFKIGITLKCLGEFDKSLRCFKQCLQVREAKLGSEHIDVAKTLNNLGVVASKLGNYPLAVQYWHRSIHAYKASVNMNEKDRVIQAIRGNIEMAERLS